MHCVQGRQGQIGFLTCHGCCWESGQPGERIQHFPLQKRCLGPSWFSQGNSSVRQNRRCRHFCPIFKEFWPLTLLSSQTAHHSTPLPAELPEDLLLSWFVLVRHDGVQPPLSPLYDGPFLVLERALHFFKVQIGSRIETVSTHRLKPCHAPQDVQAAERPHRGHPPNAAKLSVSRQPSCLSAKVLPAAPKCRRRVTLACPLITSGSAPSLRPPPAPPNITLGHPVRSTARPARYTA